MFMKKYLAHFIITFSLLSISLAQNCDSGYIEINDFCFHEGDISVLQKMIDNSYATGYTEANCEEGDLYCGSPNPYMDSEDGWFSVAVDGVYYDFEFQNPNGIVEPLELGLQEWENGRLTSIMCGAYIYCQLSGPIPEEIINLSEIRVLRLEYNFLSGFIPETICDLDIHHMNYLDFDVTGNHLCPPYPDCIDTSGFWDQDDSSCTEIGDVNFDGSTNVLDVIVVVSFILGNSQPDYQEFIASDLNFDGVLNVLDAVEIINRILQID